MKYCGVLGGIVYGFGESTGGHASLRPCRDVLCERPPTAPLSDDALPPVVWFDASSSSSSSSHRVFSVSTTLSRVAGIRGYVFAHPTLSCSFVSVS